MVLKKLYGWEFFEKLAKNKPQIGRSINDTVTMLNAERALGRRRPEATTLLSARQGQSAGRVYPTDGSC